MAKQPDRSKTSTKAQREIAPNVIDQRQQQIDPAGKQRADPDARGAENTKQPGRREEDLWDPTGTASTDDAETRQEERDELVRKQAYHIWETSGRPHGKDQEHWHKAEQDYESQRATEVRPAGPETMKLPPKTWTITDEKSDESFPASDPPGNY